MGIRQISERILAELQLGRTKKEIYRSLAGSAPKDAGKIAYCLASVPEDELRKRYLVPNAILCLLLIAYAVLNLFTSLPVKPGEPTIFIALTTIIPLVFSYFVFRFHGGIYRLAGVWFLIDLLETVLLVGAPNGLAALKLLILFLLVFFSFFIGKKVFPRLGLLGPRKDTSGNYIF